MKKLIYLFVMVMLLSGCATVAKYDAKLNTWVGASENALIASWGVPDKTYQMHDGKKAIGYMHKNTVQTGGYTYTAPQTTYESGKIGNESYSGTSTIYATETEPIRSYKVYCKTTFILDNNGKIESWNHQGDDCVSN